MLEQVARAPGAEGLLVGDRCIGQPAAQLVAKRMQMQEGGREGGEPALHVARTTAMDAAVDDCTAVGAACPFSVVGGESVDMPVQPQVPAGTGSIEAGDDVGHVFARGDDGGIE